MTNLKSTKKALLFCMTSMLVCFAMLIGSTFAWFSDSVTSTNNRIVAGNLDVEMEYAVFNEDGTFKEWKSVQGVSLFDETTRWEPGYTEVVYLKVKNVGSLSFNYKLDMKIVTDHEGRAMDGSYFKLSDYLTFGVVESTTEVFYADRSAARAAIAGQAGKLKNYSAKGSIKANEADKYLTLVVYMDEEVGNEANHMPYAAPYIDLDISLTAYQMVDEKDSFDENYDQEAWQEDELDLTATEIVVSSPKQLLAVANAINASTSFENQTITLGDNIDLSSFGNWTPMGSITSPFKGTFNGAGYTVSGLTITQEEHGLVGFFGAVEDATIKNLTVEGNINIQSEVVAADYYLMVGGVSGYGKNATIENCKNNVVITASSTDYTKIYVGGIVGAIADRATFNKCTNLAALSATVTEIQQDYDMVMVGGITSSQYVQQQTIAFNECSNSGTLTGGLNGDLAYIY